MLEFGPSTVKDEILELLAAQPGLEAKKIHASVSRQIPVTYQAVHKAILELQHNEILEKDDANRYRLNPRWLDKVRRFANDALIKTQPDDASEYRVVQLESIGAVDDFLVTFGARHYQKGRTLCLNWSHFWIPLFENQTTYAALKQMILSSDAYGITPSTTPVDRWCAEYWRKNGAKEKTGVGYSGIDCLTYADYFVQIFYPKDLRTKLDDYYAKAKTIRQLDIDGLYENVFRKKTQIPVLIIHNPTLARHVEKEIKAEFGKRSKA